MNIQVSMFPITDKVKRAVERVNTFADLSQETPIWLATSKGKDSVVLEYIFSLSKAKYEKHYTLTSVDPPEIVRMAKEDKECIIDKPKYEDGTRKTMWNLIPRKKMPPTRLVRYCCAELKESQGVGGLTATGVRWEESGARRDNQGEITAFKLSNKEKELAELRGAELRETERGGVILNLDNAANKDVVNSCYRTRKLLLNPIIDFTERDIWEVIKGEHLKYCELYDKGYKRLGCIGCPMNCRNGEELEKYPKYKAMYLRAFDKMLKNGNYPNWKTAQDVYNWWVGNREKPDKIELEGQIDFLRDLGDYDRADKLEEESV